MRKIFIVFLFSISFITLAQESYRYVIVPSQFTFFDQKNRFNLNSLTKAFFEKEGFIVYFDTDEIPFTIANNRCESMFVDVEEEKGLLVTNIIVRLKDCQNRILFEGAKGSSRVKEHQKAYNEALRNALTSMKGKLNFKKSYVSIEDNSSVSSSVQYISNENRSPLFAIPTQTGYKLVDEVPNLIFELTKSSSPDIFMAKKGNHQGLLIKKDNNWFFEYNDGNQLVSEKVEIKF